MSAPEPNGKTESDSRLAPVSLFCGCVEFKKAQQRGTDNEGYGSLLSHHVVDEWRIGRDLENISYCPWCGKRVPQNAKVSA